MRLDILLQIVALLEASLCIVHATGSQDKHQNHPTNDNGQKSVLDRKFTFHGVNKFRKIEKHDAFEQKGSYSDVDEESHQYKSDAKGGNSFEFEKLDKNLIDEMKLLEQELKSKPEWKEKYEMDTDSAAPEGVDERVFEHSKDSPKADFSERDSTVSILELSKDEMKNAGNNKHEVAGETCSKSEMANDNIDAKLFHEQIGGSLIEQMKILEEKIKYRAGRLKCDEQDEACSKKEDKAFYEDSDEVMKDISSVKPVDKYKKESQDLNNLEKDRETSLEKLDDRYKLDSQDASVSTDQELFVDKTKGSLIEQLQILEQKIKKQDDWKRVYGKTENCNKDYEIAKESEAPVHSILFVAERTQKSLLDQMKELEKKVQQQEDQKHSDVVSEHMLVNNELGMRDANSVESFDEKNLNPSTAYFSEEDKDFKSKASFVQKEGNEDEKEMLTHSVLVEENSHNSLIDQMKILEQKIKSGDDWKREYGSDNIFNDASEEGESGKMNNELEDNLKVFETSSHDEHINVEAPEDKYKREYQNTFHEQPRIIEERGGSLIDQMKKLEQKFKTREDWKEVYDKGSFDSENIREHSGIVYTSQISVDAASGQNSVDLVGPEQDESHYFQGLKRQKCFQTKEYTIPQIDTVERVIEQVIAYEQKEMDIAKQDEEFSNVDCGEHMDEVGKSFHMHDQTVNSIRQTEAPVSNVTPSKTAVINNTGQWISFLQMSCGTLAESTISKTGTKTVIERSTFMNKNIESSTTQIWLHSIPMKDNQHDDMANIDDNHQPTTKYKIKSESLDVDVICTGEDNTMDIVTEDRDNVGKDYSNTKNHDLPSNVLNEDNPKIMCTDNSEAIQMKTFWDRPYGPSQTRAELNTILETDLDKDSMMTSVGMNTMMPACESVHTMQMVADIHTKQTNADMSTKQTIVTMNTMQTYTDMYTLQTGVNENTVQTSVDVNTRKTDKNSMQPTSRKDYSAGMNTVQMCNQDTSLQKIDSSLSLQIHVHVEPSANILWYAGTADFGRVSQQKERIEHTTQDYVMKTSVMVFSSLVQDHKTSISDHLSLTSIDSVSTLEISTSHELPWQPGQAESQSRRNEYSYFDNDALYQSTSESHHITSSISHTGYSDKNTRVRF